MFKRKKWKYLILDEAHMIKNWKSQRWQVHAAFVPTDKVSAGPCWHDEVDRQWNRKCCPAGCTVTGLELEHHAWQCAHLTPSTACAALQTLLNFNSKRRLLITGTPLQNGEHLFSYAG